MLEWWIFCKRNLKILFCSHSSTATWIRLMDLMVQPSCQTPRPLLSPPRLASSWLSPKSCIKAPELSLLQTPQVVKVSKYVWNLLKYIGTIQLTSMYISGPFILKFLFYFINMNSLIFCFQRARALAASGPVFTAFTPQSILRSSLRPTPVATPSASPGRSITPPLRNKESRITFIEEPESSELEKSIRWTNGVRTRKHKNVLRFWKLTILHPIGQYSNVVLL